jgi:Na+:H+ antiporter, NhaA family
VNRKRQPPALREFLNSEAAGGIVLMAAAASALAAANSPLSQIYFGILHTDVAGLTVLLWINDAALEVASPAGRPQGS